MKTHLVFTIFFFNHSIYETLWKKTQNALLYFHNNSCYMNVPRCYIIYTLPVLLLPNLVQIDLAQLHHFPPQFMLLILLMIFFWLTTVHGRVSISFCTCEVFILFTLILKRKTTQEDPVI